MNNNLNSKVENMEKRNEIEKIILELEKIHNKDKNILNRLSKLKQEILLLQKQLPNDFHKKYLTEIVIEENPSFKDNNLILAPVGSGKTNLIYHLMNELQKGKDIKGLFLVSNRFLKESLYQESLNNESLKINVKTTQSLKAKDLNKSYLHLMTYHEFGHKIKDHNKFMENIEIVFCDEIHSLSEYKDYTNGKTSNENLGHAMKYLFNKQPGKSFYYFTATNENIVDLKRKRPELLNDIITFDYRNHPDIKKYMELSKSYISHIEQIRPYLRDRLESFNYFKHKGIVFAKTIKSLKIIENILIEEGYKPLVLWSDNNEENELTYEQIKLRKELILTNEIPEPYNFLVMNSALREGWSLNDPKVRLAIMNTTSETDIIQARGRIRKDIDLIIYKLINDLDKLTLPEINEKYINKPLTTNDKNEFCQELDLRNGNNRLMKWRAVKSLLEENDYLIENSKITIDGKRLNVSVIISPYKNK